MGVGGREGRPPAWPGAWWTWGALSAVVGTEDFLAGPWSLGHWAVCGPLIPADQPLGLGGGSWLAPGEGSLVGRARTLGAVGPPQRACWGQHLGVPPVGAGRWAAVRGRRGRKEAFCGPGTHPLWGPRAPVLGAWGDAGRGGHEHRRVLRGRAVRTSSSAAKHSVCNFRGLSSPAGDLGRGSPRLVKESGVLMNSGKCFSSGR